MWFSLFVEYKTLKLIWWHYLGWRWRYGTMFRMVAALDITSICRCDHREGPLLVGSGNLCVSENLFPTFNPQTRHQPPSPILKLIPLSLSLTRANMTISIWIWLISFSQRKSQICSPPDKKLTEEGVPHHTVNDVIILTNASAYGYFTVLLSRLYARTHTQTCWVRLCLA